MTSEAGGMKLTISEFDFNDVHQVYNARRKTFWQVLLQFSDSALTK